jgi:hypothetical protein
LEDCSSFVEHITRSDVVGAAIIMLLLMGLWTFSSEPREGRLSLDLSRLCFVADPCFNNPDPGSGQVAESIGVFLSAAKVRTDGSALKGKEAAAINYIRIATKDDRSLTGPG